MLAGESSTPYISLEIHPSAKNKIVKFDECKMLDNQIDRLTEVMDRMHTRLQGRQNQKETL